MRTIYLIRHGKPEFPDERKYCIGRTDLPLSEEGRTQIRALGETFAGRRIEKIYTSPLKRCRESAAKERSINRKNGWTWGSMSTAG